MPFGRGSTTCISAKSKFINLHAPVRRSGHGVPGVALAPSGQRRVAVRPHFPCRDAGILRNSARESRIVFPDDRATSQEYDLLPGPAWQTTPNLCQWALTVAHFWALRMALRRRCPWRERSDRTRGPDRWLAGSHDVSLICACSSSVALDDVGWKALDRSL